MRGDIVGALRCGWPLRSLQSRVILSVAVIAILLHSPLHPGRHSRCRRRNPRYRLTRCPQDCRRALVQNVVVAGGGAMLPGLCARLGEEIRALALGARHGVASGVGREQAEGYAWARAVVSGEGGDGASAGGSSGGGSGNGRTGWRGLCVVKVPVRRDHRLWAGASIMSCLNDIEERSITSEEYLERDGGRFPDWMSLSSADWVFEATQTVPAV